MNLYDITNDKVRYIKPTTNLTIWANQNHPDALINASLYAGGINTKSRNPNWIPCGTVIEEKKLIHNEGSASGFGIKGEYMGFGNPWDTDWDYFLTGYNSPVINGVYNQPTWNDQYVFNTKNYRIGLGKTKDDKVYIVTDDGVTIKQFANNAINRGIVTLVNLDGGGSRHLYYNNRLIYQSPRIPYNALAFYKDKTKPKSDGCPYAEPTRNIYWGCRGSDAAWVQWQLNAHNYPCKDDGLFYTKSVNALIAYQRANGLKPDGICGKQTRDSLINLGKF